MLFCAHFLDMSVMSGEREAVSRSLLTYTALHHQHYRQRWINVIPYCSGSLITCSIWVFIKIQIKDEILHWQVLEGSPRCVLGIYFETIWGSYSRFISLDLWEHLHNMNDGLEGPGWFCRRREKCFLTGFYPPRPWALVQWEEQRHLYFLFQLSPFFPFLLHKQLISLTWSVLFGRLTKYGVSMFFMLGCFQKAAIWRAPQ